MNNEQHPARRMRHGDRPTEPLSFDEAPAAPAQQQPAFDEAAEIHKYNDWAWKGGAGMPIGMMYPNDAGRVAWVARAKLAAPALQVIDAPREPKAYMRRWAFDGIEPKKEKNANGRMAWPGKFKVLPITPRRLFADDVPLVAAADAMPIARQAQPTDRDAEREAVARAIWNLRREDEDRCDMELEDMGDDHPVWKEADAAIRALKSEQKG